MADEEDPALIATQEHAVVAAPAGPMLLGEAPGRYTLRGLLGRGGQSEVRVAEDLALGREVAFKQLLSDDGEARFLREARLTAALEHPGIVTVHEVGERSGGALYATQELIRGETLRARLERCHDLTARLPLIKHMIDVCYAVGFAHQKGVVHRDLKPENIMLGAFGETIVLDWGIARRLGTEEIISNVERVASALDSGAETEQGTILGTPGYMPPEQVRGELDHVDARSDVWSLGAMLYEILAGQRAIFAGGKMHALALTLAEAPPPIQEACPEAPAELCALAHKALQPDREDRFADAAELAEELESWLTGGPVSSYEYGSWELLRRFIARRPAVAALGLATVVLVGLAAGLLLRERGETRRALGLAVEEKAKGFVERGQVHLRAGAYGDAAAAFERARLGHPSAAARLGAALAGAHAVPRRQLARGRPDLRARFADPEQRRCFGHDAAGHLFVWACGRHAPPRRLVAADLRPRPVALSADGVELTIAHEGGRLEHVNAETGARRPGPSVEGEVTALGVARAVAGTRDGRVWALGAEASVGQLGGAVRAVHAFGAGLIAVDERGGARLWRPQVGWLGIQARPVSAVWVDPDGDRALFADPAGALAVWQPGELQHLGTHPRPVVAAAFGPGGLTASADAQGGLRLWHLPTRRLLFAAQEDEPATHLRFDAGDAGATLRVLRRDGAVIQYQLAGLQARRPARLGSAGLTDLRVSPDGQHLAAASADGHVRVQNLASGRTVADLPADGSPREQTALAWRADSGVLAVARGRSVRLWTPPGGAAGRVDLGEAEDHERLRAVVFTAQGGLVAGFTHGSVRALDTETGASGATARLGASAVLALARGRAGEILAGTAAGPVTGLDAATLVVKRRLQGPREAIHRLAVSPDGRWIAAAGADPCVHLWPIDATDSGRCLEGHQDAVRGLVFTPTGRLLSAGQDRSLRLWSITRGAAAVVIETPSLGDLRGVALAGERVFVGDSEGVLTPIPWPTSAD
jgi:eukaryotic-like serine/threonine-protein kinase